MEIDENDISRLCSPAETNIRGNGVLLDTQELKRHPVPAVIGASNNLLQFETVRETFGSLRENSDLGPGVIMATTTCTLSLINQTHNNQLSILTVGYVVVDVFWDLSLR